MRKIQFISLIGVSASIESKELKQSVETLANSLMPYTDLLIVKTSRIELVHKSPEIVSTVGEDLTVSYTHARVFPPASLSPLSDAVVSAGLNVPVEISGMLPTDCRQRYGTQKGPTCATCSRNV